jgi:hypothetical protein
MCAEGHGIESPLFLFFFCGLFNDTVLCLDYTALNEEDVGEWEGFGRKRWWHNRGSEETQEKQ